MNGFQLVSTGFERKAQSGRKTSLCREKKHTKRGIGTKISGNLECNSQTYGESSDMDVVVGEQKSAEVGSRDDLGTNPDT